MLTNLISYICVRLAGTEENTINVRKIGLTKGNLGYDGANYTVLE